MRRLLAIQMALFFTALLCYAGASAAPFFDRVIRGQVKSSDGLPLAGVTVMVKGTSNAVTTDSSGNFAINIANDQRKPVLVFSSVGYASFEMTVGTRSRVDVQLETDIKNLNDVVIAPQC